MQTFAARRRDTVLAIAGLLAIVVISVVASFAVERGGLLRRDEVDLLAPDLDPRLPLDAQVLWSLRWLHEEAANAELTAHIAPSFLADLPAADIAAMQPSALLEAPYEVRGVIETAPNFKALLLRSATDIDVVLVVSVAPEEGNLIDGLGVRPEYVTGDTVTLTEMNSMIAAGVGLGLAGLLVRRRGGLLTVAGLLAVAQTAELSGHGAVFTIGLVCGPVAVAVAAHWVITRRDREGGDRAGRLVVVAGYGTAVLASAPLLVVRTADFGLPGTPAVTHSPHLASVLLDLRAGLAAAVAVAVALVLVQRGAWRPWTASPPRIGALLACGATAAVAVSWLLHPTRLDLTMSPLLDAAVLTVALGVLVAAALAPLEFRDVAQFVTDLGDEPAPVALRDSVGRALGDPSVEIAYWSEDLADYVSANGERWTAPPGRLLTNLSSRGAPLAIVSHDAALGVPDARVAAVCAAARIALDNERLQAQVRAQLGEVQASRTRIVEAADEARRRIERDLHDGVQQRLLAVLIQLRRAAARQGSDGAVPADELRRSADELAGALDDVRAIGRGLHPPALDHGLAAALGALAETAPLPVELALEPFEPLSVAHEAAIYFAVAEGITNAVRHATGATHVAVRIEHGDGVTVEVSDDGCGGADVRAGSGLQRSADRFAALGGRFSSVSPVGEGTTLRWWLPVGGSA